MINHLNGVKIAWDNLVLFHRSMFLAQRHLDGVLNYFAERWWGTKTLSMFKMGYEIFSNCAKLSSALVPRIKSDRSLTTMDSVFFVLTHKPLIALSKTTLSTNPFFEVVPPMLLTEL